MKIFGCKNLWAHPPDSYREVRATDSPDGYRDSRSQVQVLDKKLERCFGCKNPWTHPPDSYLDYRDRRSQVQVLDKKLERCFGCKNPWTHPDNYREVRAPDSPDGYRDSGPRFKSWIKNLKDILGL